MTMLKDLEAALAKDDSDCMAIECHPAVFKALDLAPRLLAFVRAWDVWRKTMDAKDVSAGQVAWYEIGQARVALDLPCGTAPHGETMEQGKA